MDKFMRKIKPKAALKGAHLKDIRRHFRPTDDSYDNVQDHQTHRQRLLLRAEPQVGKTGEQLRCIQIQEGLMRVHLLGFLVCIKMS